MTEFSYNSNVTNANRGIPSFTLSVPDGDANADVVFAEQDYFVVTSSNGQKHVFVIVTTGSSGTVIVEGDSTGSLTLPANIANLGTCIRVLRTNLATQAATLNTLGSQIETLNDIITRSSSASSADGPQTNVFVEPAGYYSRPLSVDVVVASGNVTLSAINQGDRYNTWETLVANADDDAEISARIKDGMTSSALGDLPDPGYNINNTEYASQFIPGIASYKKKVK